MSYQNWFDQHAAKHRTVMQKLTHLSTKEVIEYFRFENMVIHENDFCPLYAQNKKCHDTKHLNCYLCACPHFRYNDAGIRPEGDKTLYSLCSILSPEGGQLIHENAIHQDCSGCLIPHDEEYIRKVFDRDWRAIMSKVPPKQEKL